ncbi:MAG: hypothetical protein M3Y24_10035 [Acidobacteriota bacterium]|nr:hypothetical protein [Acidobacteriota bacterium]
MTASAGAPPVSFGGTTTGDSGDCDHARATRPGALINPAEQATAKHSSRANFFMKILKSVYVHCIPRLRGVGSTYN